MYRHFWESCFPPVQDKCQRFFRNVGTFLPVYRLRFQKTELLKGRVKAQEVSRRPLTADIWVSSKCSQCEIYGWQTGTGTDLSVLQFLPVRFMQPLLHTHSYAYNRRYRSLAVEDVLNKQNSKRRVCKQDVCVIDVCENSMSVLSMCVKIVCLCYRCVWKEDVCVIDVCENKMSVLLMCV